MISILGPSVSVRFRSGCLVPVKKKGKIYEKSKFGILCFILDYP
jgi:hypothetical protein